MHYERLPGNPTTATTAPLPSPYLMHVRAILGRLAHLMGSGELSEDDDDGSDDEWYPEDLQEATILARSEGPEKISSWLRDVGATAADGEALSPAWGCPA